MRRGGQGRGGQSLGTGRPGPEAGETGPGEAQESRAGRAPGLT